MPPPLHGWEMKQHTVTVDLLDGQHPVQQHLPVPSSRSDRSRKGRTWQVTATESSGGNQVSIGVTGRHRRL